MDLEFIINGQATGQVGQQLLANNLTVNCMRPWVGKDGRIYINVNGKAVALPSQNPLVNASTLRKDEWKELDTAVLESARERLVGVQDLISAGLVRNTNGLGTTILEYEDLSDMTDANVSMDAVTPGEKDRVEFSLNGLPLPIIHKDFMINARVLASSRNRGESLDATQGRLASEIVSEKAETILFQGHNTFTFGTYAIYGYTDHPNRNTVTLSLNWDDATKTGAQILTDVLNMKQALINDRMFGNYMLYIPTAYETKLDENYVSGYPTTIRQRIMEVSNIMDIKVADKLPANNVVMVRMNANTVRLVQGMPLTTVQWQTDGNMRFHYKVMAIWVPQIRADQSGRCGVAHLA